MRRQSVGSQVRPLRVPQVLLLVPPQQRAVRADEVRRVGDALGLRHGGGIVGLGFRRGDRLEDRAGRDGDVELGGERLVPREVRRGLLGRGEEDLAVGLPGREVVFGQDGKLGALGGGFADVRLGAGEVAGDVERLSHIVGRG